MDPAEFDALVRATRWGALRPFLNPEGSGKRSEFSACSPFFGAVQVDDFQLVPLLQALRMPRVWARARSIREADGKMRECESNGCY
jgi:hypothetical protein